MPVGADAVEILGLHDVVFEYEITSNRVDCYSSHRHCQRGSSNLPKGVCSAGVTEDRATSEDVT